MPPDRHKRRGRGFDRSACAHSLLQVHAHHGMCTLLQVIVYIVFTCTGQRAPTAFSRYTDPEILTECLHQCRSLCTLYTCEQVSVRPQTRPGTQILTECTGHCVQCIHVYRWSACAHNLIQVHTHPYRMCRSMLTLCTRVQVVSARPQPHPGTQNPHRMYRSLCTLCTRTGGQRAPTASSRYTNSYRMLYTPTAGHCVHCVQVGERCAHSLLYPTGHYRMFTPLQTDHCVHLCTGG